MARVPVPVTVITRAGVAPAAHVNGDPVNHHSVANAGNTFLLAHNNGVAEADLTIHLQGAVDGQPIEPRVYPLPAAAQRYIGPFPTTSYGTSIEVDVETADLRLSAYRL